MNTRAKRPVSLPPEAKARVDRFVEYVDDRLLSAEKTADAVREILARLPRRRRGLDRWRAGEPVSLAEEIHLDACDPRCARLKADARTETDEARFEESKPPVALGGGRCVAPGRQRRPALPADAR